MTNVLASDFLFIVTSKVGPTAVPPVERHLYGIPCIIFIYFPKDDIGIDTDISLAVRVG